MPRILFVTSEAHPLVKTGGLGDVAGSLPVALQSRGADVRLLLPAYRDAVTRANKLKNVASLTIAGLEAPVKILEGRLPGTSLIIWLADFPPAYDRPGNPYLDSRGQPWPDNAMRFALLAHVATALALGRSRIKWRPDVVHGHDWQTGLVPVLLAREKTRPATIFTIHNLAYQGLFPHRTFTALALPPGLWSPEALEFHDQLSFMKGGLVFADQLTTVSPTYAREIQTPEFGDGLDGLLRRRAARLSGILNGIDDAEWDPARDRYLVNHYSAGRLQGKAANKLALQREFGLPLEPDAPLIGMVGRLVAQKGIDLVLDTLPGLMHRPLQLVLLGSGEAAYETALVRQAARYKDRLSVRIGYDEGLAHRIEAGADMFLMPSRFEPCGLNQLYSLRYGTVPIVRRAGGLADTVVDATPENIGAGKATGIVFQEANGGALLAAMDRALALWRDAGCWQKIMRTGMRQDFSWRHRATKYMQMYERLRRPASDGAPRKRKATASVRRRRISGAS
ncbi:glycogen synthase [Sulfuricaulis limicola]|uniref:Glycogen synthase n=1 Tax=Sulfuricaulis limicola TaxID=1620215 RepID=A0A1B4XF36_9GAMM|nr:glycogen synthase GlgA [Sulfuricaulis limicola]BAV33418.1 glycogen synthase [Sulfuricaulis limicola]